MKLMIAAFITLGFAAPVLADDESPTTAQRASVLKAIGAVGCNNPSEIERDDGGYEVDKARCKDGLYDLKLSADFKILSREKETN